VADVMPIFVFGSNLAGRHGKGAALFARQHHGAVYGQGEGLQGTSYALPTKDARLRSLPLEWIGYYVLRFLDFAQRHPDLTFHVTPIGCGLAGYAPAQIAPLFCAAPANCVLPPAFAAVLDAAAPRYRLLENGQAIQCLTCTQVSHNPHDVAQRYCGHCHQFLESPQPT
jgi:hypothetical protein